MTKLSLEQSVKYLRSHLAALPPPRDMGFEVGEIVMLDNGCLGIVGFIDPIEDDIMVYFIDEDDSIQGPSCGWELSKVDLP